MHAQLVRATGVGRERHLGAAPGAIEHAPPGDGRLAVYRIVDLTGPVVNVHADGEINHPLVSRNIAIQPRDVALADLAQREQTLQRGERGRVLGRQQQARGIEIETMHHQLSGSVGVARAQPRGHRIAQQSAAPGH